MAITQLLLAARSRLTDFTLSDNAVSELTLNKNGRLRVSSKAGLYPASVGNLINVGDQVAVDVSDASMVRFHVKNTGSVTYAAGAYAFEGSIDSTNGIDGTWFVLQAARSNSNSIDSTGAPSMSISAGGYLTNAWTVNVNGVLWFRIKCTTAATAGSILTWTVIPSAFVSDSVPSISTHGVTNTPTAGSAYSATTAASTNAAVIKASAGNLFELSIINTTAATIYVKLFNTATAPTLGSSTVWAQYAVAAGASQTIEFGAIGKRFSSGISIATTANAALADTTAVAAGAFIGATYI